MSTINVQYSPIPPAGVTGMKQAEENAEDLWKAILTSSIVKAAQKNAEITVDEVLDEADQTVMQGHQGLLFNLVETGICSVRSGSALGPLMKRAQKDGVISSTGQARRSKRESTHGRLVTIWKSNLYVGGM